MENNQKILPKFLNPYCSMRCINNLKDGKLQCHCAESGIYAWEWEEDPDARAVLAKNNQEITFHPVYSSGTAALRGVAPLKGNQHHFWEMKMMSNLYGTDVMIGVGTGDVILTNWRYRFFSLLGSDNNSWGYSYHGAIQHENVMQLYGSKFGLGSLVGVHLDMLAGTLEFSVNRKPLGVAFKGLKTQILYPMICSTAAQSAMKMTFAASIDSSLQLICLQNIIKHRKLYNQFKNTPGLARIYESKFFWILPKEYEDTKRKSKDGGLSLKRQKVIDSITSSSNSSQETEKLRYEHSNSDSDSNRDVDHA